MGIYYVVPILLSADVVLWLVHNIISELLDENTKAARVYINYSRLCSIWAEELGLEPMSLDSRVQPCFTLLYQVFGYSDG